MPSVRKEVVAILCSDIHLSLRPPAARAGEPDWLRAQRRPLDQLKNLQKEHKCPILCAGDVFDRWNSPVELVNWAILHLPQGMLSIPGQHDLPYHSMDMIQRSAYWTVKQFFPEPSLGSLLVEGFSWGVDFTPPPPKSSLSRIKVALVHRYVWTKGHSYPGVSEESHVSKMFKDGMGWDVIVCGDNHKGFMTKTKAGTVIFNCGTLQRRKADEVDYRPQVGLLYKDGSVEPFHLDTSEDIIESSPAVREEEEIVELGDFLQQLKGLRGDSLDFKTAILHAMDDRKVSSAVRRTLLEAMGNG